jgi:hypothetical protein
MWLALARMQSSFPKYLIMFPYYKLEQTYDEQISEPLVRFRAILPLPRRAPIVQGMRTAPRADALGDLE